MAEKTKNGSNNQAKCQSEKRGWRYTRPNQSATEVANYSQITTQLYSLKVLRRSQCSRSCILPFRAGKSTDILPFCKSNVSSNKGSAIIWEYKRRNLLMCVSPPPSEIRSQFGLHFALYSLLKKTSILFYESTAFQMANMTRYSNCIVFLFTVYSSDRYN